MTAAEVEELITIPMEQSLRGVPGLDIIRSKSADALSQVVLLFKPGVDLIEARQNVQKLMNVVIAGLPQSSGMPIMLQPLSSKQPGHEDRHHVEDWGRALQLTTQSFAASRKPTTQKENRK
jgi:multidrug efflux pump subunit AcrB